MSNNFLIPSSDEILSLQNIAKHAENSKFFHSLGGQAGIFSLLLYAKEMGLPLMHCLFGGMRTIQGKIEISPQLMNGMIRKAGHKLEIKISDEKCEIKGIRKDTGEECIASFSIEDAKRAKIYTESGAWGKYPSDMCFARAMSRLARRLFPDIIGTSYITDEIEDNKESNVSTIEINKEENSSKNQKTTLKENFLDYVHDIDSELLEKYILRIIEASQGKMNREIIMQRWCDNPAEMREHFEKNMQKLEKEIGSE